MAVVAPSVIICHYSAIDQFGEEILGLEFF